jgi:alkanesulfonate monooxygenase SsuD/methylene tetrahydromethanopterin reductase-like flavin-dependent oxidoreductase (luciferase family)
VAEAVGVTLPVEDGLPAAEYVALAQLAERSGYDAVLAGEVAGPEVFSLLGMIAARTTSIRIGSGIVGCYARPPALTAMGFATLASYAPGRVIAAWAPAARSSSKAGTAGRSGEPVATVRGFIAVLRQSCPGRGSRSRASAAVGRLPGHDDPPSPGRCAGR